MLAGMGASRDEIASPGRGEGAQLDALTIANALARLVYGEGCMIEPEADGKGWYRASCRRGGGQIVPEVLAWYRSELVALAAIIRQLATIYEHKIRSADDETRRHSVV